MANTGRGGGKVEDGFEGEEGEDIGVSAVLVLLHHCGGCGVGEDKGQG